MDNTQQAESGIGQVQVVIVNSKPSDKPTAEIIHEMAKANLKGVIILGYDEQGREYIDTNIDDGGDALWLLQRAIHRLMNSDLPK